MLAVIAFDFLSDTVINLSLFRADCCHQGTYQFFTSGVEIKFYFFLRYRYNEEAQLKTH